MCERDRRKLRCVQDFVGIGVADAAADAGMGEGALERPVFGGERLLKGLEVAGKDFDSAWIDGTKALFARDEMQRSAVFGAGFSKDQRAAGEIESRQAAAAGKLRAWIFPVQAPGNHQMQHEPKIAFDANRDALTDSPQFTHWPVLDGG